MNIYNNLSTDQLARITAKYMQSGKAYLAKNIPSKKLYKLIKGLSNEIGNVRNKLNEQINQYDIYQTSEFIEEFETMLGIPDECFSNQETLEIRQNQIVAKMIADGIENRQDLIDVIAILGYVITITNAHEVSTFPVTFPWRFFGNESQSSKTLVITFPDNEAPNLFPAKFPWVFGGESYLVRVECFIRTLISSTNVVVFEYQENFSSYEFQNGDTYIFQDGSEYLFNHIS